MKIYKFEEVRCLYVYTFIRVRIQTSIFHKVYKLVSIEVYPFGLFGGMDMVEKI